MNLEITGKIIKTLPAQKGESKNGPWTKQDFIIETLDSFPKKVCISCWGDKVAELNKFSPGDEVKASINIESREFNERWYTDVKAWRLEGSGSGSSSGSGRNSEYNQDNGMSDNNNSSGQAETDDLPF